MSSYVLNDVVLPVRIAGFVFCILGTVSNSMVAFLSFINSRKEKVAFALLMQVSAISNVIATICGFTTLNRCTSVNGTDICIPLGPGALLGERFCNIVDSLVVHINSYLAVMIGWMMLVRAMILYGFKPNKLLLIFWTVVVVFFPWPQYLLLVSGFKPSSDIPTSVTDLIRDELAGRVFFSINVNPNMAWMWIVTSYLPLAAFIFCIPLRIAMELKLRKFSTNLSKNTKHIHRSFMNMVTVDAIVTFAYYICCNDALRKQYFPLTLDIGYLIFSIPVFIQGFSTLYFVPNLMKTLRQIVTKKQLSVSIVSHSQY